MSSADITRLPISHVAEELALRVFRPGLLDQATARICSRIPSSHLPVALVHQHTVSLLFYLTGFALVERYGRSKFTLAVVAVFRDRMQQNHSHLWHDGIDAATVVFASALKRHDAAYTEIALAEAFAAITGQQENGSLRIELIHVIERFRLAIGHVLDEIIRKPDVRMAAPPPFFSLHEVQKVKDELRATGPHWYRHLWNEIREPASQMMLARFPEGAALWGRVRTLQMAGMVSIVLAAVAIAFGFWPIALLVGGVWHFGVAPARAEVIYEISARLFLMNRRLREGERGLLAEMSKRRE